jgi:hypothetical protein
MRVAILAVIAGLSLPECQDAEGPSQARVIHIAIEGCKDAPAPTPAMAFVSPAAVAASAATLAMAASTAPAPVQPLSLGAQDPTKLAADVHTRRDEVQQLIQRRAISLHDFPDVAHAVAAGDHDLATGDLDEAMTEFTGAYQDLDKVRTDTRIFVDGRRDRVQRIIDSVSGRISSGDKNQIDQLLKEAKLREQSFDYRGANERLQLADQRLDALLAPVGTPSK